MKKALTHTELNNFLIEQLVEFLTIAQESADMEEQERAYINNDLDTIDVAYFGKEPDGDNQVSISESNLEINFAMAFSILTTRIENSCFVFEIEKSETLKEPGIGTHATDIELDLFESSHLLPEKVKSIIDRYGELDEPTYENCEALLKELQPLGYTFDYELDAIPYDLRPINSKNLQPIADILNTFFRKSIFNYDQSWPRVQNTINRYERNDITLTYNEESEDYQITLTGIKTNPTNSLIAIKQIIELYDRD